MQITKLSHQHNKSQFDCGVDILNRFIKQQANQLLKRHETVIYVAVDNDDIAGFYTLSNCEIMQTDDHRYLKKQSPYTPIPCALLGRLAVDNHHKGKGLGADLLLHAMQTVKKLSEIIGIAFVIVDAKDNAAKQFYQHYGFVELSQKPMRLCYAVKDIPDFG